MVIKETIFNAKTGSVQTIERELTKQEIAEREQSKKYIDNLERENEIKNRLQQLDNDFRQADLGAIFEDLNERRAEFISLHNELRVLKGKKPREYK